MFPEIGRPFDLADGPASVPEFGPLRVVCHERVVMCGTLFLFAQANFDPIGRDGCSLDNVPDEAGGARAFCPGCGRVWLRDLDSNHD